MPKALKKLAKKENTNVFFLRARHFWEEQNFVTENCMTNWWILALFQLFERTFFYLHCTKFPTCFATSGVTSQENANENMRDETTGK